VWQGKTGVGQTIGRRPLNALKGSATVAREKTGEREGSDRGWQANLGAEKKALWKKNVKQVEIKKRTMRKKASDRVCGMGVGIARPSSEAWINDVKKGHCLRLGEGEKCSDEARTRKQL